MTCRVFRIFRPIQVILFNAAWIGIDIELNKAETQLSREAVRKTPQLRARCRLWKLELDRCPKDSKDTNQVSDGIRLWYLVSNGARNF